MFKFMRTDDKLCVKDLCETAVNMYKSTESAMSFVGTPRRISYKPLARAAIVHFCSKPRPALVCVPNNA